MGSIGKSTRHKHKQQQVSRLQTRQKSVEVSFRSLGRSRELNASSRKLPDQHAETSLEALLQVPHHQVRRKFSSSHAATNQLLKYENVSVLASTVRSPRFCLEVLQQLFVNLFGNRKSANAPCFEHSRSGSDDVHVSGSVSSQPQTRDPRRIGFGLLSAKSTQNKFTKLAKCRSVYNACPNDVQKESSHRIELQSCSTRIAHVSQAK